MDNNKIKLGFQSINFSDLDKFHQDLELDEIALMQYLIFHCRTNRGKWFHSAADIGAVLKIKKHRFKSIIDSFEKREWINVKTGGAKNRRIFTVNFEKLFSGEFLSKYYDYSKFNDEDRNHVAEVFFEYLKDHRSNYSKILRTCWGML